MAERVIAATVQFNGITTATNSIAALKRELKKLKAEQAKADPTSERYRELSEQIGSTSAQLRGLEQEQKRVNKEFEEVSLVAGSYAAIQAETKKLTIQLKNMKVGVNATQEEYDALLGRIQANNAELTRMNREMRNSKSIAERFREGAVAAFKDIALNIAAGVTALQGFQALKGLGELGLDIERGFAQVNTVAQLSQEELKALQSQVLETARTSTADLDKIPTALFNIVSATGDVDKSQEILAVSLKASKAGFTDVGSAATAGTQIFQAAGDQVENVTEVFDVLFRTQKEGVLTFQDLSRELPKVIASANQAGFAYDEVAGSLATVTKAGIDANKGATILDATFREIADPTRQAAFKKLGASIFDAEGQTRPLVDVIGDLDKAFEGLNPEEKAAKIKLLGLSGEASKGIGILTDNVATLGDVTNSVVNESLGELQREFDASANTSDDLKIAYNDLKVTLINELQPAFVGVGRTLIAIAKSTSQFIKLLLDNKGIVLLLASAYLLLNAAKIQNIAISIKERIVYAALLVQEKAQLVLLGLRTAATTAYGIVQQVMAGKLTIAAAAQLLLNAAMNANPVGLLVAGTVALTAALVIFTDTSKKATKAEQDRAKAIKFVNESIKEATEEIGKETAKLEILVRGIKSETASKEEKKQLTDQLLSQYGNYLTALDKEAIKAGDVELAYRKIKSAITATIVARQQSQATEELFGQELQTQLDNAVKIGNAFNKTGGEVLNLVDTFKLFPASVKEAIAEGKGLALLGTEAGKGFSESQKEAVRFFTDVEKFSVDSVDGQIQDNERFRKKLAEGIDPNKLGVNIALQEIIESQALVDQGLEDINKRFGQIGSSGGGEFDNEAFGAGEAAKSIAILEKEIQGYQDQQKQATDPKTYSDLQKEINRVRKEIEAITGASDKSRKASEKNTKSIEANAQAELEAEQKRAANLLTLRKQLNDQLIANEDDANAKRLAQEEERYKAAIQLALDNSAKITLDEDASDAERLDAEKLQNQIIEQLTVDHYAKLNEITGDALKAELAFQEKTDADKLASQRKVLDLSLETVNLELENEEKNFAKRKQLIDQLTQLKLEQLKADTALALSGAKNETERTAILENETAKRIGILRGQAEQIKQEKEKEGPLLARILGISPIELAKLDELFKGFTAVLSSALDQFFKTRLESLENLIAASTDRIGLAAQAAEDQVNKVTALEERLATATGTRRQNLIRLIEEERKREAVLFAEKVRQEKIKEGLEKKKAALEAKQAKIRKAQAIAEAISNTAVGITRTIAEVPKVDFGVSTAILIGLYTALGAAQVALISAQKFAKGGKIDGPSHDNGGITMAVPSQNRFVELEGGEHVTNKRATSMNEGVLDRINKEGHRTKFSLVSNNQAFADGGRILEPNFQSINAAVESDNGQSSQLNQLNELLLANLDKPIFVSVTEYESVKGRVVATQDRATT